MDSIQSHGFHPVGQLRRLCASSFVLLNVDGGICPVHVGGDPRDPVGRNILCRLTRTHVNARGVSNHMPKSLQMLPDLGLPEVKR